MKDSKTNQTKILVTGATGFLGNHFYNYLLNNNYVVSGISTTGNIDAKISQIDLLDYNKLSNHIQDFVPEIVFHIGAKVDLSRDYEIAKECINANIHGTLNLLESTRGLNVTKFIFISSEEVYGANQIPFKETELLDPPSPYAISKVAAEQFVKIYANELGFKQFILRVGTIFGPQQQITRFIPSIIMKAINGSNIDLNDGEKKRDYIYIDDVISVFQKIIDNTEIKDGIYNISGGVSYRLKDLVDLILDITQSKSVVKYNILKERLLESRVWLMDIQKSANLLNWTPSVSLENGLKETISYYLLNK